MTACEPGHRRGESKKLSTRIDVFATNLATMNKSVMPARAASRFQVREIHRKNIGAEIRI
jgi:hypothetical protein